MDPNYGTTISSKLVSAGNSCLELTCNGGAHFLMVIRLSTYSYLYLLEKPVCLSHYNTHQAGPIQRQVTALPLVFEP